MKKDITVVSIRSVSVYMKRVKMTLVIVQVIQALARATTAPQVEAIHPEVSLSQSLFYVASYSDIYFKLIIIMFYYISPYMLCVNRIVT